MNDDLTAARPPVPAEPPALPPVVPDDQPVSAPPQAAPRGRRIIGVVLPAVLVLGAVGGGLAYTKVTVDNADRTSPTVVYVEPEPHETPAKDPAGNVGRGRASTPLSKLLLPVPEGYRLGPDIESHGNDAELSGKEAAALMKEDGRGLSGKERREFEKRVDKLGVGGIAVRSFATNSSDLVVEIEITRMNDKKYIHDAYELQTELLGGLLDLPKGPKITGHKRSACFLMPQERDLKDKEKTKLDGMVCTAYESEFLVSVRGFGIEPFEKAQVAELVKDQLDHISSPGEYI
ncbi:hypothetical protein ACIQ7Q_17375 [Streptomyces sp. NPDC096176]|uniref:hypothetical protein n=1 Tax=Streptomyces sp. NPDC096176 TaxID=3366079 RepID=UPI003812BD89